MEWVAIVAGIVLAEYMWFGWKTGEARGRFGVPAPATTGHPTFERWFRVQANTVEQLVVFFPALVIFAVYVSEPWAAALGGVFALGRALYARGYVEDPARRGPGFLLTILSNAVLLLGGVAGALASLR